MIPTVHMPPGRSRLSLEQLGLFYLGLSVTLPFWFDREGLLLGPGLVAALALAWRGWQSRPGPVRPRTYFLWALLASLWTLISSTAVWSPGAFFRTATFTLWVLFLIPGLAGLLRWTPNRSALLAGLIIGAATFGVIACLRLAEGKPSLDLSGSTIEGSLLGLDRNAVNMRVLLVIPFVAAWSGMRPRGFLRWPLLAVLVTWVITSGGRSGLVGLALVGLMYALLQPNIGRRSRALVVVALLGLFTFTLMQEVGGQARESTDRLTKLIRGERTGSDEARDLLRRKAWHVAIEHPLVGVGAGNLRGYYHPVVEEASKPSVRRTAITAQIHNTYAETMASIGFPGAIATFAMLASVLLAGLRRSRARDVRLAVCAFGGMLFMLYFFSGLASLLFIPMALVLGAVSSDMARATTDREGHRSEPGPAGGIDRPVRITASGTE